MIELIDKIEWPLNLQIDVKIWNLIDYIEMECPLNSEIDVKTSIYCWLILNDH